MLVSDRLWQARCIRRELVYKVVISHGVLDFDCVTVKGLQMLVADQLGRVCAASAYNLISTLG